MLFYALLLLVVVLLFLIPAAQRRRERQLAERLRDIKDPHEAMLVMDKAIAGSRGESSLIFNLLEKVWPGLFR